jgi:hypothetical protein
MPAAIIKRKSQEFKVVIYAPEVQSCSDSGVPYRRCMPVVGAGVG